ncbi:MAG: alpha/beta hydrolase [Bacteroidetes bacterium]|nr:alpha/beta hydrolase [Bacteroidota bacterium]
MNWKIKLVLLFGKLRKPIDPENDSIESLRKKAERAAWLGTLLFDKHVAVKKVTDANADGVPIRIYQNNDSANQRVIIYYHGGGFVLYGLTSHDNVCRRLCKTNNCIVVAVDYRLAPEFSFPHSHIDAFTAIQWVRKNISIYGGNPDDLVVAGDSAGGNLSACMAHCCKKENVPLKAQVLIYPWIDGKLNNPSIDRKGHGYLLEKETMFWFQSQYTPRKEDQCHPAVSPCYETDFANLAPAFILTAEFDPLVDDGYKYFKQLEAGGNGGVYKEYKNLFHGFFNLPGVAPISMQSYFDIRDFLKGVK